MCSDTSSLALLKHRHLTMNEEFEIVGHIEQIETIAVGNRICEIDRLRKVYGPGRWRKLKGIATVRFQDGTIQCGNSLV